MTKNCEVHMSTPDTNFERFMREAEVRRITGLSRTTRWRLERRGAFPRRRQISPNGVAWLESEIRQWQAEKVAV